MDQYLYWYFNTVREHIVQVPSEDMAAVMATNSPDYIVFTANLHPEEKYPHKFGEHTALGPECFTDGGITISYKGANYYRACGKLVRKFPDGSTSSCVSHLGHRSNQHEDMAGHVRYA